MQSLKLGINHYVNKVPIAFNEEALFGENSFVSIFVVNTDYKAMGLIEYVNEEIAQLLGFNAGELTGKDINTIIPNIIARDHRKLMI